MRVPTERGLLRLERSEARVQVGGGGLGGSQAGGQAGRRRGARAQPPQQRLQVPRGGGLQLRAARLRRRQLRLQPVPGVSQTFKG